MAKNKGGRPHKMTESVVNKLEEAFAMDCSISEACVHADISRQAFYNWKEKNPKLFDRFELLRSRPFLKARRTIVAHLDDPDYAFKYMERKKRKEFSTRIETENENTNTTSIKFTIDTND